MSFGKHFGSMYSGSMVGSGAMVFAVWGYVIANMKPVSKLLDADMVVELNPKLLGPILGESQKDVGDAIRRLCSPDEESRTKEKEGRRMEDLGAFLYRVVNGQHYRKIRSEEERREYLRIAQQKHREKKGKEEECDTDEVSKIDEGLRERRALRAIEKQKEKGDAQEEAVGRYRNGKKAAHGSG